MNKVEQKHLEAIENSRDVGGMFTSGIIVDEAATSCAEITKEYAMKFDMWKDQHGWQTAFNGMYYNNIQPALSEKTHSELWDLFINDLNEKV